MRLAQIVTYADGLDHVHSIFEADVIPRYAPPCDRIFEVDEEVGIGWLWNHGAPTPPPPPPVPEYPQLPLDAVKAFKRAELMGIRDQLIFSGFDWHGHHYPLSPELSGDMLIKLMAMQMQPPPAEFIYQWKDDTGVYRDIGNADAFKTFCAAALSYGETLFAKERMLQELVEAAESIEAVEAITWETVPEMGG